MKKRVLMLAVFSAVVLFATGQDTLTKKAAKKWFKKKEWLMGMNYNLNKPIDVQEFARQYHLNKLLWQKAFEFLKSQDLNSLKPGKYQIDGNNVYASVTEAETKDFDKTNWESHRKYIDLQFVIEGEEKMGVCKIDDATVTKPYDEKKDVANYSTEKGKFFIAHGGSFFIFFPNDAHRPNISPVSNKMEKKLVIKIKVADEE